MYRIGYDAKRLFNNFTGLGNYSRTLLRNLAAYYPDEEYFLYTPTIKRHDQTRYFLDSPMFNVHTPSGMQRLLWRSRGVVNDMARHEVELYHGLSHEIPQGLGKKGIPAVVTIHDLIFKHYPEQYRWWDRQVYDYKFRYACEQSQYVIAISESTKQDVMAFYGIPEEKIRVVYQSCHEGFMVKKPLKTQEAVITKYGLPPDFFLYVGSLIPRKNLLGIVEALHLLPADLQLPVVVVGQGEAYQKQVMALAARYGLVDKLYFIRPAFADLPALYQHAQLFLYPSYYEGFGIPIIEALFSETPVITSNVSSLPEAAGPESWLVNPASAAEIAHGMEVLLTDTEKRQRQIVAGFEHAQQFLGAPLTEQLMAVYEEVL